MCKFIIIVYVFVTAVFVLGCDTNDKPYENNIMQNTIAKEQIIENKIDTNTTIQENEILTNISSEITKEETKEKTINNSENIEKNTTTKPKNETISNPSPTVKPVEKPTNKKEETNTVVPNTENKPIENNNPSESTPAPTPEENPKPTTPEVPKKNGYFVNEEASAFLLSEFYRLTNGNSNFTAEIDSKAKGSNPFWPYSESEITKQLINITFGDFIVYAEDYYKDDVKQRTLYYICFDS